MLKRKRYLAAAFLLVASFLTPTLASASQLTQAGVRLGRLGISASAGNDLLVTYTLNTTPTNVAKIIVTLPAGFNITTGSPAVTTTGFPLTPGGITPTPGTLTAAAVSSGSNLGGTITVSGLTSASLNNSSLYGLDIASGTITNPATANQYNMTVASANSSGTPIDTTLAATYIYGTVANQDQIIVNESVAPTFSFSLSGNADTVPQVDPTATQTSPGVTMTVSTNSPLGYSAYVHSANGELVSATNPGTPITTGTYTGTAPTTMTPGTTDYGFVPTTGTSCSLCTGSLSYDPEYQVTDASHAGAFNGTGYASFVERNGYTNADQVLLRERVDVASTIGYSNDYTDTLTIVAAGNY